MQILSPSRPPDPQAQLVPHPARRRSEVERLFRMRGTPTVFARNRMIAAEQEPVAHVYRIDSGFVRCCSYTRDGLRQIFAFAGPGDLLGFPDVGAWHFTAEAVDRVSVRALKAEALDAAIVSTPGIALDLRRQCVRQFQRRERHLVWLSYLQSDERLLAFLEDFEEQARREDGYCRLPMTRLDIGDHLGMSLETVSRSLGSLRQKGAILMDGRSRYRVCRRDEMSPAA